ncbi:metallophosphoesterase [Membranihabitans marinus]
MYLIGDAGNANPGSNPPVLQYLKSQLDNETQNSSVFFLGDNIYPAGMPPKEDSINRDLAEYRLTAQLKTLDHYPGRPVFIPGNHDYAGWGQTGLEQQEKFVESYINKKRGVKDKDDWENYFLPDDGCSGPEVIELNDDIVVIVVNSNWWLADLSEEPKLNTGCEARNRASFKFVFENAVRKYRNKNLVIAMHHPPYTYGPHGGKFTAKEHLFPLTEINPNLFIPFPVIGSLAVGFRTFLGSRQDVANLHYKELRSALLAGAKKNGEFIFISGHEHGLQYIENDDQKFVVSGSASKKSPVGLGKGSLFASGAMGYSALKFYENGETWIQFFAVDESGKKAKIIFEKKVKEGKNIEEIIEEYDFSEYHQHRDSITRTIIKNKVEAVGDIHKFILGEHHRAIYMEEYDFPILDLDQYRGGVTPVKQGGGNQTNSLRVEDSIGKDYALREMTKDVTRFLPYPFNKMVAAKYLVEDNFLSTHPFAPFAIPNLAEAVDVYHTNPKLYYIPKQPSLGEFNYGFGGDVNLVEERPSGKYWKDADFFGNADKIISTIDLVNNLLEHPDHQVDEAWALRSRLFDFIIGDWDRHDDQWRWAKIDQPKGRELYRPIPRDRDQAFSKYDGLVPAIARQTMPFMRQLQSFGPEIQSMKWTTWSARLFDRTFLNELSWTEWEKEVKHIQKHLTDSIIDHAFDDWPQKVQELSAADLKKGLKARRDHLMDIARTHFEFLSKSVDVIGTEEEEMFEVNRLNDSLTHVRITEVSKKGKIKQITYDRIFENKVTKEIILYGNGARDRFEISGQVKKSPKIRLVGGLGKDTFIDNSKVNGLGKKTLVYDDLRKNIVELGSEAKDKRTSISRYNIYDRRGYDSEYNMMMPIPILGYNPDDKFKIGLNMKYVTHRFKKIPFASEQHFGASYAFGSQALALHYRGDFLSVFKEWDFYLNTRYHGPTYSFNYAGLGNETIRSVDNQQYYRVRQERFYIYPAIKKRFAGQSGFLTLGPTLDLSQIEYTANRLISNLEPSDDIFDTKQFIGGLLGLYYNNLDNTFAPHSGIQFESSAQWNTLMSSDKNFTALRASLSFFKPLDSKENLILASQIGWAQNYGDGYEFFQMPNIGGDQLRGYRAERFYGQSSFWQSTDLRIRLTDNENQIVPFSFGLFGSFDYGRVWLKEESSSQWHHSTGGGFWVSPLGSIILSLGGYFPKEGIEESPRIVFKIGFGF